MRCALEFDASAELIVGYGAGTLEPGAAAAFERHIELCATCCDAVAAQKAVWAVLDERSEVPISPDFDRRLWQRIEQDENRRWWLLRALLPVAACAAITALLLLRQPDSMPAPAPQPALQIEQVQHALDDMDMLNQLGVAI